MNDMKREDFKIEVCANSVESVEAAVRAGADRVELCAGMPEGGTTPSWGTIRLARERMDAGLHVIIRPRGGDFLYSDLECEVMLRDIEEARRIGVDGLVFGCLTADGQVDVKRMKDLMAAAGGLPVTFHRAFDMCCDPLQALRDVRALGCRRILTSGQEATAEAETETGEQQPVPRLSRPVRIMVTVIVVLIVLLLAYVALNHLSPGIFDNILYDSEQRKILERYCFEISSKL